MTAFRKVGATVVVALLAAMTVTAQTDMIVSSGAHLEKVFGGAQFTEGPAAGPDGMIYFSDLTFDSGKMREDGYLWQFNPGTKSCIIVRSPSGMSNGNKFDRSGRLITAQGSDFGGRGLIRSDMKTRRTEILVSDFEAKPLNSPNDLVIDSAGRIYFTDPRYGDRKTVQQPCMGVYRRDPDGTVVRLIADIPMPNGIALAPDERMLYVGCFDEGSEPDHRPMQSDIRAFPLSPAGEVGEGRMIVKFSSEGGPDGITTDRAGHIYAAVRYETHPGIGVYASSGRQVAWIALPEVPSNVAFSRPPQDSILYITAGGSLYRIRTTQHGFFAETR